MSYKVILTDRSHADDVKDRLGVTLEVKGYVFESKSIPGAQIQCTVLRTAEQCGYTFQCDDVKKTLF